MCDHFEQRLDIGVGRGIRSHEYRHADGLFKQHLQTVGIPRHMVVRETNAQAAALARRALRVSMQLVATQVMPAFMRTEVSAR
jgi:hypothetical protein